MGAMAKAVQGRPGPSLKNSSAANSAAFRERGLQMRRMRAAFLILMALDTVVGIDNTASCWYVLQHGC
jgi:hypothetical protein